jgi:hypothetical protein
MIQLLQAVLVASLVFAATGAQMTKSKISVHAGGLSSETQQIIGVGRPRVVKLLDSLGATATAVKKMDPGVLVIGRIYQASQPTSGDPTAAAEAWWTAVSSTVLSSPDVDAWEGYNEPSVGSTAEMSWYTKFEVARVHLLASHGLRAVIGCFSTGSPDVTNPTLMNLFAPAIDAAIAHRGILAVHEYASPYMWGCFSNVTQDGWYTGRYRKWYNQFLIPQNRSLPLVISEAGIDAVGGCGGPSFGGYVTACSWWQSQGWGGSCHQNYVHQLAWYDSILRQDAYVIGATVFQIDCPGWGDYDVGPAAKDLTSYLVSQQ